MPEICTCYVYTPCCGGHPVLLARVDSESNPVIFPVLPNVYIYDGASPITDAFGYILEPGQCYRVQLGTFGSENCAEDLVPSPPYTDFIPTPYLDCNAAKADPTCTECPKKTLITPCCGGPVLEFRYDPLYPISTNVYQYTGTSLIFDSNGVALTPYSCFTIQIVSSTPEEVLTLVPGPASTNVISAGKTCGNYSPELTTPCADCFGYYEITNCADSEEVYCTNTNLSAYINNLIVDPADWPVIQVLEKPGKCFYVEQVPVCSSPITITPDPSILPFTGCFPCQQSLIPFYELIDCNNSENIIYTSTDVSLFVGQYITVDEYPDVCFFVDNYTGPVPSDTPVTPTGDSFETCAECSLKTYKLEDCAGIKDDVITNTDLSAYVGEVIVIDSCPDTCWFVQETEINTPLSDVFVNESFTTCPICLVATLPAICVSFELAPNQTSAVVYVVNTNGASIEIVLNSENPYVKGCYLSWRPGNAFIVTEFGDCIDNRCPEIPQPKRKVTPGYDTPTCTPEYYEKVECNYSEWMYKQVLEERYGISNCCPEELMKWEIKHEMLMLDSLVNPDYDCQPPIDCGCPQPTTCGCSCNSRN